MAKETKPEVVEIPKEEYEEMVRTNQENSALIKELAEKLDTVQTAQLAGAGIDPKIMARSLLPRKTVQFTRHYSVCAIPSLIQKDALIMEAYSISCGDIVNIREDEFKRISKDFPDLMEANPNKFQDKIRFKPVQVMDKNTGLMKIERVKDPQPVDVLLKLAYDVG